MIFEIDSDNNIKALSEAPATDCQLETFATEEELAACAANWTLSRMNQHGWAVEAKSSAARKQPSDNAHYEDPMNELVVMDRAAEGPSKTSSTRPTTAFG